MTHPLREVSRPPGDADDIETQASPAFGDVVEGSPIPTSPSAPETPPLAVRIAQGAPDITRRAQDLLVATIGLTLTLPLTLMVVISHLLRGSSPLTRTPALGRHGETFNLLRFNLLPDPIGSWMARWQVPGLGKLLNVMWGEMTLVGPRPLRAEVQITRPWQVQQNLQVRPGMTSLWWIRQRTNTDYEGELEADREYIQTRSLRGDLRILLSTLVVTFYGARAEQHPEAVDILGIKVDNLSLDAAVSEIVTRLEGPHPTHVAFLNAHNANVAQEDPWYRQSLLQADLVLADGIGIKLAGNLLGTPVRQNVNGTDLFPKLCQALAGTKRPVFLLGAREEVVQGVARWMAENHPTVPVCGAHHGLFPPEDDASVATRIATHQPALLLVAMGTPRQETWIRTYGPKTGAQVSIGVGGLFDFYSHRQPRAPRFVRDLGFEWIYRLFQEPSRLWRRYVIGNPLFLLRVLMQRLSVRLGRSSAVQRGP